MLKEKWKRQFKPNFFKKCCKLIYRAKPINKPKYFFNKKYPKPEDCITYDYIEAIKKVDIKKNIRTECGSKQKCRNNFVFQEPDITFSTLDNTLKTYFECKILGSNSKYINMGIQRFISGKKYSFPKMTFYGMLGYVRDSNSATKRYIKLKQSINNKKSKLNLINQKIVENSNSQVIFKTKHKINNGKCNSNIEITHILHYWN